MEDNIEEDFEYLFHKIRQEGFDYCFDGYSNWKEIEDPIFQKLKEEYLLTKKLLNDYVESKVKNI